MEIVFLRPGDLKIKHLISIFEYGYKGCAKVEATWDIKLTLYILHKTGSVKGVQYATKIITCACPSLPVHKRSLPKFTS